ncbi:MAG: HAMP domain-containing histidine kinase [Chloroflexi bacterium]|nr:HAMP domain-containing histidine kinase [Chloroflexota bacterium]
MASLDESLPVSREPEPPAPEMEAAWSPEEAALVMRLRIFVRMRWFAVFLIILATLVASYGFGIGFPTAPVYVIAAVIVVYNYVLLKQVDALRRVRPDLVVRKARTYGYIHIVLDLIAASVLMHFTGGIENPFIFLFVFHIIAASIVLNYRIVYLLATLAILLVVLVVGLEYAGIIPHVNLEGFASPELYRQESYILAVLISLELILYVTTYSATAISGELRKRQREVVLLRERLLEQKTGDLKKASDEVAKLEEERNRFLRFIGIAAHDLKAPLTAIQGFLWVILGGYSGEINEKQKNMLERCTKRIKELLTLISDLLDIPRIETGQIIQEKKVISLRQVITSSLNDLRDAAREKGIKLKVELPKGLSHVRGSASRLQQVITNLVNNAISYTPKGTITVRVKELDREIVVEIIDTGIGIPAEDMPKLFEDFFRASNVEARGTGLGLSIARRIIEAHGGKIWAESPAPEMNFGSKFSFTLPKQKLRRRQP